jgi:hypothetical protein
MSANVLKFPKAFLAALIMVLLFSSRVAAPVVEAESFGDEVAVTDEDFSVNVEVLNNSTTRNCTFKKPGQLSFFYKPAGDLSKVIKKNRLIVFTRDDEPEMRQAKSSGRYPVLQYIRWDSIHDPCGQATKPVGTPCSCSNDPNNNNVGWEETDICNIRDNHPDWFLRDGSGNLIIINNYVVMDPMGRSCEPCQRVAASGQSGDAHHARFAY